MSPGVPSSSAASTYCDENQGITGLVFTWLLLAIGIIVVSLRLHVRLGLRHNIGWDDYTAVASLVSTLALYHNHFFYYISRTLLSISSSCSSTFR